MNWQSRASVPVFSSPVSVVAFRPSEGNRDPRSARAGRENPARQPFAFSKLLFLLYGGISTGAMKFVGVNDPGPPAGLPMWGQIAISTVPRQGCEPTGLIFDRRGVFLESLEKEPGEEINYYSTLHTSLGIHSLY